MAGHWELVPPEFRVLSSERTAASTNAKGSYRIVASLFIFPCTNGDDEMLAFLRHLVFLLACSRGERKESKTKLVNCLGLHFLGKANKKSRRGNQVLALCHLILMSQSTKDKLDVCVYIMTLVTKEDQR